MLPANIFEIQLGNNINTWIFVHDIIIDSEIDF